MTDENKKDAFNFYARGTTDISIEDFIKKIGQIKNDMRDIEPIYIQYGELDEKKKKAILDKLYEQMSEQPSLYRTIVLDGNDMATSQEILKDLMGHPVGLLTPLDDLPKSIGGNLKLPSLKKK